MIVAIHQPEHMVYLGFLNKLSKADYFILLNHVQFEKNNFQNRNKIRTHNGWEWLTVPIEKHNHKPIYEVKINNNMDWQTSYLAKIKQHYSIAPYFSVIYNLITETIRSDKNITISQLNITLLLRFLEYLKIATPIILSSNIPDTIQLTKSKLLVHLCRYVTKQFSSEVTYLSGEGARNYLDEWEFANNGIGIKFNDFVHPTYPQLYNPFIANMSIIDLLFNCGSEKSRTLIMGENHG